MHGSGPLIALGRAGLWPHAGHVLGAAAVLYVPLAVVAPMGETPLFAAVALVSILLLARDGNARDVARPPLAPLFGVLLLWALVSGLWAVTPSDSISLWFGITPLFVGCLVLVATARRIGATEQRFLGACLVAGFVLGGALLAFELASDATLGRLIKLARTGTDELRLAIFNRALSLAVLLAWPVAVALWRRGWLVAALTVLGAILGLTLAGDSLSARIACAAGLLCAGGVALGGRRAVAVLAVLFIAGIAVAPVLPRTALAPARVEPLLTDVRYSALHRLQIWEFAAHKIGERPIAGWGLDAARSIPGGEAPLAGGGTRLVLHPHNAPLQVWLELGFPGAAALVALLAIVFHAAYRHADDRFTQAAAVGMTASASLIASLSFGIWQNWWLASLGLGAAFMIGVAGEARSNGAAGGVDMGRRDAQWNRR